MKAVLIRHIVIASVLVVAIVLAIAVAGWSPRVGYLAALGLLLAVATAALRRLGESLAETTWPSPVPRSAEAPGVDPQIGSLETLLRRSAEDAGTFRRRLRPLLADLTTHRLARDCGIDPSEHPDEARQLLGEDAWSVLTSDEPPTAAQLERTVAAIERIPLRGSRR